MPIFPDRLLTPPHANELEICIFGPGYGESVVLHIPAVGWGIIDSCTAKVAEGEVVLPLEYLTTLLAPQFPKLAFVILTHPHEDHYKGLDRILQKYPGGTERVCRYDGDGIRELKMYIATQRTGLRDVLPGFAKVLEVMKEAAAKGAQFRRLLEMTSVFNFEKVTVEEYGTTDISMIALSPSALSVEKYIEMLFSAIPKTGEVVLPMRDEAHNLISVALLLKLGDLQVIFGSDLESGSTDSIGWKGVIYNKDCPDLRANLVKVAHHGSESGHNSLAWKQHCDKTKPIAVITPFSHGGRPLPEDQVVATLRKVTDRVGITSRLKLAKLSRYYSRATVMAYSKQARHIRGVLEESGRIGFIRVRLLLNGTIAECLAEPPAYWV